MKYLISNVCYSFSFKKRLKFYGIFIFHLYLKEVFIITNTFTKLPLEKQIKILDAAADVFAEEGYHYGNISDICKKSQISNGALYKYFKNKESLFLSVLDYGISLVETELYIPYFTYKTSIFDTIEYFLNKLVEFTQKNISHIKIYCDLGSSSMNHFADISADKYKQATSNYICQLVDKAKEHGEIKESIPTYAGACLIDNYIILFSYSIVSKYHKKRFNTFFSLENENYTIENEIKLIIDSLKSFLS